MGFKIGVTPDGQSGGITARLQDGRNKCYQWDENLRLVLTGCKVGDEIHFDMPGTDVPIPEVIYEDNGELVCDIPPELLQAPGKFKLWIYDGNRTIGERTFKVEAREKPPDYNGSAYLLIDEEGNEYPAVLISEEVIFTATANDIRKGTVAATEDGVTEGEKVIPSFHTTAGYCLIPNGSVFATLPMEESDKYDYTKLQVLISPFNKTVAGSVAVDKVAIDDKVYDVKTSTPLATVEKDGDKKRIVLGIKNNSGAIYLMRYFTYKEID